MTTTPAALPGLLLGLSFAALLACASAPETSERAASPNPPAADAATGLRQSPIDLPAVPVADADGPHAVTLRYRESAEHIVHSEHTIELFYDAGSSIEVDGETFELVRFHFHTPSEHQVAGRRHPAELHLVHRGRDGGRLVVSVLFDAGSPSPFLERILTDAPASLGRVDHPALLNVGELFPADGQAHFMAYEGSLTTSPFTEGVRWLVLESHPQASPEQIVRLLVLEGGNAREIQDRHERPVVEY